MNRPLPAAAAPSSPPANPLLRWLGPPAKVGAILAGWALLGLSFMVGLEVILRKVFSTSLQGADEMGGYAVALVAAFGFAWTLLERGHTRIDLFTERLPAQLRRVLNVLALLSLAVFAVFMAWRAWTTVFESIDYQSLSGTPLMTPLWWPQSLWVAGLSFFAAAAAAVLVHGVWLAFRNPRLLDRWYGPRSLADDLEDERASLRARGLSGPET